MMKLTAKATVRGWRVATDGVGGLVVHSPAGRTWYPSLEAERMAAAAGNEGHNAELIRIARHEAHLGKWFRA